MKLLKSKPVSVIELSLNDSLDILHAGRLINFDYPLCHLHELFKHGAKFWAIKNKDDVMAVGTLFFCDKEGNLTSNNASYAVLHDWAHSSYYEDKSLSSLISQRTTLALKSGVYNVTGYLKSGSMENFWHSGFSLNQSFCDYERHIVPKFVYTNWLRIYLFRLLNLFK